MAVSSKSEECDENNERIVCENDETLTMLYQPAARGTWLSACGVKKKLRRTTHVFSGASNVVPGNEHGKDRCGRETNTHSKL